MVGGSSRQVLSGSHAPKSWWSQHESNQRMWIIALPVGTDMRLVRKLFDLWRREAAKRGVK